MDKRKFLWNLLCGLESGRLLPVLDPGLSPERLGLHQEHGAPAGDGTDTVGGSPQRDSRNVPDKPGKRVYSGAVAGGVSEGTQRVSQRGRSLPGLLPFPGRTPGNSSGRCPQGGLKPRRKSRGTRALEEAGRARPTRPVCLASRLKLEATRVTSHSPPSSPLSLG